MRKNLKIQIARSRLEKDFESFVYLIPKLQPIEFFGLAKIFGVALYEEAGEPRPFGDMLEDMMERFEGLGKKKRKEILGIMREAIDGGRK